MIQLNKVKKLIFKAFKILFIAAIVIIITIILILVGIKVLQEPKNKIVEDVLVTFHEQKESFEQIKLFYINTFQMDSITYINFRTLYFAPRGIDIYLHFDGDLHNLLIKSLKEIDTLSLIKYKKEFLSAIDNMEKIGIKITTGCGSLKITYVDFVFNRILWPPIELSWKKDLDTNETNFIKLRNNYQNKDEKYWIFYLGDNWYIHSEQGFD